MNLDLEIEFNAKDDILRAKPGYVDLDEDADNLEEDVEAFVSNDKPLIGKFMGMRTITNKRVVPQHIAGQNPQNTIVEFQQIVFMLYSEKTKMFYGILAQHCGEMTQNK